MPALIDKDNIDFGLWPAITFRFRYITVLQSLIPSITLINTAYGAMHKLTNAAGAGSVEAVRRLGGIGILLAFSGVGKNTADIFVGEFATIDAGEPWSILQLERTDFAVLSPSQLRQGPLRPFRFYRAWSSHDRVP